MTQEERRQKIAEIVARSKAVLSDAELDAVSGGRDAPFADDLRRAMEAAGKTPEEIEFAMGQLGSRRPGI